MIFSKNELNNYFKKIDDELGNFSSKFQEESKDFSSTTSNQPLLYQERMLGIHSNEKFKELFMETGFSVELSASEFCIEIRDKSKISEFEAEIEGISSIPTWNKVYVDGFFKLNKDNDTLKKRVFVEYKRNNKFIYLDLAKDFLKYKIYTNGQTKNTVFIYSRFNGDETKVSIIPSRKSPDFFVYLNKCIDETTLEESCNYVYEPDDDTIQNNDETKIVQCYKLLEMASKIAEEYKENNKTCSQIEAYLIDALPSFNKKVIESNITAKNYKYFEAVINKYLEMNKETEDDFYKRKNGKEFFFKSQQLHPTNFVIKELKKNQNSAFNSGLLAHKRTSLMMVSAVRAFCEIFNLNISETDLLCLETKKTEKNSERMSDLEISNESKVKIVREYSGSDANERKLENLCMSYMLFVKNYYAQTKFLNKKEYNDPRRNLNLLSSLKVQLDKLCNILDIKIDGSRNDKEEKNIKTTLKIAKELITRF